MSATAYKLAEAAQFAVGGFVLVEKGEVVLFKDLKEFLSLNLLQRLLRLAEIHPQNAAVAAVLDARWHAIPLLDPAAYLVMVRRLTRTAHCVSRSFSFLPLTR